MSIGKIEREHMAEIIRATKGRYLKEKSESESDQKYARSVMRRIRKLPKE